MPEINIVVTDQTNDEYKSPAQGTADNVVKSQAASGASLQALGNRYEQILSSYSGTAQERSAAIFESYSDIYNNLTKAMSGVNYLIGNITQEEANKIDVEGTANSFFTNDEFDQLGTAISKLGVNDINTATAQQTIAQMANANISNNIPDKKENKENISEASKLKDSLTKKYGIFWGAQQLSSGIQQIQQRRADIAGAAGNSVQAYNRQAQAANIGKISSTALSITGAVMTGNIAIIVTSIISSLASTMFGIMSQTSEMNMKVNMMMNEANHKSERMGKLQSSRGR